MANSPNILLPFWSEGQDLPNVTHNEALLIIDILVSGNILDRDLTAPPGSPAEGDIYLVASVASGDWVGEEDSIAYFFGGVWKFLPPREGQEVWVIDEGLRITFLSAAWVVGGGPGSGATLLMGQIDAAGLIDLQVSAVGASVSVAKPGTGIYDLTFTGITASNVHVDITQNEAPPSGDGIGSFISRVTTKSGSTGRPTPAGCRIEILEIEKQDPACGGCPVTQTQGINAEFTFEVKEMN